MLDKNGLPLQFPPSAFSAFSDPRAAAAVWHPGLPQSTTTSQPGFPSSFQDPSLLELNSSQHAYFQAAQLNAAALAGQTTQNSSSLRLHAAAVQASQAAAAAHANDLNQRLCDLQAASVGLNLDPLGLEASRRASRKRHLAPSPYAELELANALIRYSPTASLSLLNSSAAVAAAAAAQQAATNGSGSPGSSGSFTHLSTGAISPALSPALSLHNAALQSAHLQQLQAHLIRSASTSPFLSPQNSLQTSLFPPPPTSPYLPILANLSSAASPDSNIKDSKDKLQLLEASSNVVSSTMEDEDSKDRADLSPKREYKCFDSMPKAHQSSAKSYPKALNLYKKQDHSDPHHQQPQSGLQQPLPTSAGTAVSTVKEIPDFIETHCYWDGCDKEFHTQEHLVKHLNNDHIGANKKSFICQWKECSREKKPFKAQYMLVVHMRRHTGEKPHMCTFENCSKAYSRLENLKTHLRSHTGEKPYTCEFPGCTKAFSNASDRAKHQNRTHSNEKPYACKAEGCTKRYTDPSSLRKHVKTVHGPEFYASKRHKGNHYDTTSNDKSNQDNSSNCQSDTPQTPLNMSTFKSEVDHSLSANPMTPSDSNPGSNGTSSGIPSNQLMTRLMGSENTSSLPLSDNNISTTNDHAVFCQLDEPEDLNMAVAAAIGVDDLQNENLGPNHINLNPLANRLQNKLKHGSMQSNNTLGEINRSIEKMSIGSCGTSTVPGNTMLNKALNQDFRSKEMENNSGQMRRDSNWTNSTEGYGSMRSSEQSMLSRRGSDISIMSQCSNLSTRAVFNSRNSPWADPSVSACSSRRSSLADRGQSHPQQQLQGTAASNLPHHQKPESIPNSGLANNFNLTHRQFFTSDGTPNPPAYQSNFSGYPNGNGTRRASDPVGMANKQYSQHGSQTGRRKSYTFMNSQGYQRTPIHGQPINGQNSQFAGGMCNQANNIQQQFGPQQQSYNYGQYVNNGQVWPQQQQPNQGFQNGFQQNFQYNKGQEQQQQQPNGMQWNNLQQQQQWTNGNPGVNWAANGTNSLAQMKMCDPQQRTFEYVQQQQGHQIVWGNK